MNLQQVIDDLTKRYQNVALALVGLKYIFPQMAKFRTIRSHCILSVQCKQLTFFECTFHRTKS
jgi:hypothetical protein